jgi:hypothetical protein
MILSCCAVDFASAERAFSCVHWLPIGTTRPMRTAHAIHRGSSAIVSSAAGLRVCQRLTLSAQHIRRTQAELVGFSANAPSPRRAHSTRAVQSDSAPRPAPPLDHIESAAWGGGRFCVRIARALRAQPAALPTQYDGAARAAPARARNREIGGVRNCCTWGARATSRGSRRRPRQTLSTRELLLPVAVRIR